MCGNVASPHQYKLLWIFDEGGRCLPRCKDDGEEMRLQFCLMASNQMLIALIDWNVTLHINLGSSADNSNISERTVLVFVLFFRQPT